MLEKCAKGRPAGLDTYIAVAAHFEEESVLMVDQW